MAENLELKTHGPHNDEYTRKLVWGLAEVVRTLNYATQSDDGLRYPATSHDVFLGVVAALDRLPQLLTQTHSRLRRELAAERLRSDDGRPPAEVVAGVQAGTETALQFLAKATHYLSIASGYSSHLALTHDAARAELGEE
jgi:hypothetical protein